MPKGKKFNAAEKHFLEKENAYRQRIRALEATVHGKDDAIRILTFACSELAGQNLALENQVERLLEYTELSKADIKAACLKDKELVSTLSALQRMAMW